MYFFLVLFPKFRQLSLTLHIKLESIPPVFRTTPQYYELSSLKMVMSKLTSPPTVYQVDGAEELKGNESKYLELPTLFPDLQYYDLLSC